MEEIASQKEDFSQNAKDLINQRHNMCTNTVVWSGFERLVGCVQVEGIRQLCGSLKHIHKADGSKVSIAFSHSSIWMEFCGIF